MHAATAAWRACVWTLLLGSIACFVFISFARPTEWYRTDQGIKDAQTAMNIPFPGDVPIATTVVLRNGRNTTVNVGRDVMLMSGGNTFPIVLQWGSLLLAGLCTVALLPGWRAARPECPSPFDGSMKSLVATAWFKVRRIATYPLPPRHFWNWFCGGLNAVELLVYATWLGYAVVYVYYNIDKGIKNIGANLAPPPPVPGRAAPPSSPGTGVPSNLALPAMFLTRRLNACAKATGEALRGLTMVMFLPISRSSFLKWLFGADFSYIIKFHRWMSWGTLAVATLHGLLYMIYWGAAGDLDYQFKWEPNHRNVTGLVSLIAGLAIAVTSTAWMRANYYKVFLNVHIIGFILFVMFGMMHYKALVNWIVPGLLLYGLDRAFRFWQLASNWTLVHPSDLTADGSVATLKLRWASGSRVLPGQTLYLRVPKLSWFQSHPFSVASVEEVAPADPNSPPVVCVMLHMKVAGSWTKGMCGLAWEGQSAWVQVEGPYDTCLEPVPSGPAVVMIAGGIGITPLLGLLRHYLAHPASRPRATYLLWTCRALCELRLLGPDLAAETAPLDDTTPAKEPPSGKPGVAVVAVTTATDPTDPLQRPGAPRTSAHLSRPWLRAALHYTGLEAGAETAIGDLAVACSKNKLISDSQTDQIKADAGPHPGAPGAEGAESGACCTDGTSSSDSASNAQDAVPAAAPAAVGAPAAAAAHAPRLLAPHPLASPALYAACLTVSVFGAFAGLTAASYNDAYQSRVTALGVFYPVVGVSQWFLVALGMAVPPIILLAALAGLRRLARGRHAVHMAGATGALFKDCDHDAEDPGNAAKGPRALELTGQVGSVGNVGCVKGVAAAKKLAVVGQSSDGKGLVQLRRGRPDVAGLLRRVRAAHVGECAEVEVLVGGPPAMWEAVQEACVKVGAEAGPGPALRARRVAYQH